MYIIRNHSLLTSLLTLTSIQTLSDPFRPLVLPDYSRLCHMTSRSRAYLLSLFCCRLLIIILNPNPSPSLSTHLSYNIVELNYDIHNKELLAIFKAFKIWQYYLEDLTYSINIVTDHKNLEYFSSTKVLIQRQAQQSKYLSQFNLIIRSGHLSTKLNTLIRWWNIYPKEENINYTIVNPYNFKLIFTQEQLVASILL